MNSIINSIHLIGNMVFVLFDWFLKGQKIINTILFHINIWKLLWTDQQLNPHNSVYINKLLHY